MEDSKARDETLRLDYQLCFPLYAASRKIVNLYTPHLRPLGLTYTRYLVLMALWQYGSLSVGDLCRMLYLDSGTVTPLLKKMESEGLVVRKRSSEDERVVTVDVTAQSSALKESLRGLPERVGACVSISPEEIKAMLETLRKILDDE